MSPRLKWLGVSAILSLAAMVSVWMMPPSEEQSFAISGDPIAGQILYVANCASCHGANLEGQSNWRVVGEDGRLPAPPHDAEGHTWHHSDKVLWDYTNLGGTAVLAAQGVEFDSGMPGFSGILTEQEVHDVLAFIKSTWPHEIQAAQSARSGGG